MTAQAVFDFTQLDTETPNLDLIVITFQILEAAIDRPAHKVAGAVQPGIGLFAERVGKEALFIQLRAIQVAARNTGTTDIQLTGYAQRHWLASGIQHIKLQVRYSPANRTEARVLGIGSLQRVIRHVHRGFSDAVHVDQLRPGVNRPGVPGFEYGRVQRFATEDYLTQRVRLLAFALSGNQLPEGTWRLVQHRHACITQQGIAFLRRTADQVRDDQQLPTVKQRAPDFPDREVESKRVEQCPDVSGVEAEPRVGGREQTCHVAMFDLHAFRQTSGAGGVDHIGKMRGIQALYVRILDGLRLQSRVVQIDDRQRAERQRIRCRGLHQHCDRCAVLQQIG
ncbi:hypothetical protein ALO42_200022 [Pseudomonas syringae pv. atrofaciens]|nr:hypothetical protein ALO42_200022 [Pseudomonas syringae pv. atrofaciens]